MIVDVEYRGRGITASVQLNPEGKVITSKEYSDLSETGVSALEVQPFGNIAAVRIFSSAPDCIILSYHSNGAIDARKVKTVTDFPREARNSFRGDTVFLQRGGLDDVNKITVGRPGREQIMIAGRDLA